MPSQKNNIKNNSQMQAQIASNGSADKRLVAAVARALDSKLTKKGRRKSKQVAKEKSMGITSVRDVAKMIDDPCGSALKPGLYGSASGYLSRFHGVYAPQSLTSAPSCGIVLWSPNYSNVGAVSATSACWNSIVISANSPSDTLSFAGVGGLTSGSGSGLKDPAYDFVNGGVCAGARCLSACIRFTYTGQVTSTAGLVSPIRVPFSVIDGIVSGTITPTVNTFLQFATGTQRLPLDSLEVKWRPTADDSYRTSASGTAVAGDHPFIRSTAGVYNVGSKPQTEQPELIGFVFRGLAVDASANIQFDFYKNIEWAPEITSGLAYQPSVQMSDAGNAQRALAFLDRTKPGWDQEIISVGKSFVAKTAMAAFTLV